jgi:site-specific DNA recombinase
MRAHGATGTDDRRPAFQEMMERASDPEKPFDVIVIYAFNRFYRNGAELELAVRKLRKNDVEVARPRFGTGVPEKPPDIPPVMIME